MANYTVDGNDLTDIADAIIAKAGLSGQLEFPDDFISGIQGISGGTDVSDTTATASDVRTGKYFYTSAGVKTQGTIADQAAQTIHPSTTDQTIASGKYLAGAQTIKGVLLTNLAAGNIKKDVVVKVGDSTDDDCVTSVTGTYEGGGGGGGDSEDIILQRTISGTYENGRITTIGTYAFAYCDRLESISCQNVTTIQPSAFQYCTDLETINFPNCSEVGSAAFNGCGLIHLSFPECVTVYAFAFSGNTTVQTLYFPKCTTIGASAFANCRKVTTIDFPKCATIGNYAFNSCFSATTASFENCTAIGSAAFSKCFYLLSLYLMGSSVATLSNANAFTSTPISTYTTSTGGVRGSIFVPASLYNTYITATNWATYASRFVSV